MSLTMSVSGCIGATPTPLAGKKVLVVYGGWEGHDPVGCRDIFVPWLTEEGAEVILSDSLGIYKDEAVMKQVDLVVQTWTMGEIRPEEEAGLLAAVEHGTGLAGWHGGLGDSFRNSTAYQFMVGGQFVAHPGGTELYYMHVDPAIRVLATTRMSGEHAPWLEGVEVPVVWKKIYGDGRVFYSALGHTAEDFSTPEVLEIMKRGIRWAVRQ